MAGVNKVILVGNLGDDPESALAQQWRRGGEPARRHVGELEGQGRQPPGADRMAPGRHLQRESRPGRQILSAQGLEGLSRGPDPDPQMAGPVRARTNIRPKWCCSASAASWSCSTAAAAAAAAADFGGGDYDSGSSGFGGSGGGSRPQSAPGAGLRQRPGRRRSVLTARSLIPAKAGISGVTPAATPHPRDPAFARDDVISPACP